LGSDTVIKQDAAEAFALEAFVWVLNSEFLTVFLTATGADHSQLAALARDAIFLGGVLDFLMEEDARVIGFCDATERPYLSVMEARAALPGGQLPHWT
jgi:hypothetical protein